MSSNAPKTSPYVNELAAEVLGHIFELRQQGVLDDGGSLLQLASVCRRWNEVARGCPQLWTGVQCELPGSKEGWEVRMPGIVRALERWFRRAGELPMTLHVTFRVMVVQEGFLQLIQFIAQNSKWNTLRFTDLRIRPPPGQKWDWAVKLLGAGNTVAYPDTPCWPLLETFQIFGPEVELDMLDFPLLPIEPLAPNLQNFTIDYAGLQTISGLVGQLWTLHWSRLSTLSIHGAQGGGTAGFLLFLLKHTQNLRRMEVSESRVSPSFPIFDPAPDLARECNGEHPNLQFLSLDISETVLKPFFQNIRFPALRSIELKCRTRSHPREYSRFLNWTLEEPCKNPDFWPQLSTFSLFLGDNLVEVKEGNPGFVILKQAPYTWYILAGTPFGSP